MSSPRLRPFDLSEPLTGNGRLAVTASAGTGKTFTLAALVCRYVAEADVDIGQVLVVTFTRAAAAELRERVRGRLASAAAALAAAPDERGVDDVVTAHLLDAPPEEVERRRRRLERAVVDFDTATITTIHGFCAQVLAAQGSTGRFDTSAVVVQDPSELVDAAVADVLVREALSSEGSSVPGAASAGSSAVSAGRAPGDATALPDPTRLTKLVSTVLDNPGIELVASSGDAADETTMRLVDAVVDRVREQLVRTGGVTFDEQLRRVAELLRDSPAVRDALAGHFEVVMVDESQDTDPVQWAALSTAFDGTDSVLVVVGDPKQAIYGFRGGDVDNYLAAVDSAEQRSLGTNHRSDATVVDAMNRMWEGVTLGHPDIPYAEVTSATELTGRSLRLGAEQAPGLWIRSVTHPDQPRGKGKAKPVSAPEARAAIREDLANRIVELLDSGSVVHDDAVGGTAAVGGDDRSGDGGQPRRLLPSDIAVLVKARSDGPPIQRALLQRGVASVIVGSGSVTESLAASHWRWLIEALRRPSDVRVARAVALSWFFEVPVDVVAASATGEDRDSPGAEVLASVQTTLMEWVDLLARQGVAAMTERIWRDATLRERLLARPTGERDLTDLDHLAELLHIATRGRPVGPERLAECFDALDDPDDDAVEDPDAVRRRIDTDTAAVRIMTVHVSKGLEFGVVCCPTLWSPPTVSNSARMYHDDAGRRVLDVSAKVTGEVDGIVRGELAGEQLRLTYVALTRALHATLVWWAPVTGCDRSGLARLLFGTDETGERAAVPGGDRDTVDVLDGRIDAAGASSVVRVDLVPPQPEVVELAGHVDGPDGTVDAVSELRVARLGRVLDRSDGRWSFTSIASRALHPGHEAERPAGGGTAKDADDPVLGDSGDDDEKLLDPPVLFDGLGAGAAFGTLVHAALEAVDFSGDLESQLHSVLDVSWSTVPRHDVPRLVAAIAAAVRTPLGSGMAAMALADLPRSDRLDELEFELPLGDRGAPSRRTVDAVDIGRLLLEHLVDDDPVRPWARSLADGRIDVAVGGHLTGSIDLVLRVADPEVGHRYSVVDYKTNRLGDWGEPDRLSNYHPDNLAAAMEAHDYPLQAVLYLVALHRYLRWRLPGYRPELHLGPVGYLFVRGMVGPQTPAPGGRTHGVFTWSVPPAAVVELSDLLHGHIPGRLLGARSADGGAGVEPRHSSLEATEHGT